MSVHSHEHAAIAQVVLTLLPDAQLIRIVSVPHERRAVAAAAAAPRSVVICTAVRLGADERMEICRRVARDVVSEADGRFDLMFKTGELTREFADAIGARREWVSEVWGKPGSPVLDVEEDEERQQTCAKATTMPSRIQPPRVRPQSMIQPPGFTSMATMTIQPPQGQAKTPAARRRSMLPSPSSATTTTPPRARPTSMLPQGITTPTPTPPQTHTQRERPRPTSQLPQARARASSTAGLPTPRRSLSPPQARSLLVSPGQLGGQVATPQAKRMSVVGREELRTPVKSLSRPTGLPTPKSGLRIPRLVKH